MICCIAVCLLIVLLPFIIGDLYFAHNDHTCVNLQLKNKYISITLGQWLVTNAYISIANVGFLGLVAIAVCYWSVEIGAGLIVCYILLVSLVSLFQFAWTIIGAIMFWG